MPRRRQRSNSAASRVITFCCAFCPSAIAAGVEAVVSWARRRARSRPQCSTRTPGGGEWSRATPLRWRSSSRCSQRFTDRGIEIEALELRLQRSQVRPSSGAMSYPHVHRALRHASRSRLRRSRPYPCSAAIVVARAVALPGSFALPIPADRLRRREGLRRVAPIAPRRRSPRVRLPQRPRFLPARRSVE